MADSDIGPEEIALVNEVLRSRALSCGPMIDRFEAEWAARIGRRHAVAVSSGTAGLHLSMIASGVRAGDLVLTSPYSFVASANAVLYQGAVPVFVDVDPISLNIDVRQVAAAAADLSRGADSGRHWLPRRGGATPQPPRAVLPIHVFGRPADMPALVDVARPHGMRIVEDACEAAGAEFDGRQSGTFGDAAVFGFFPNKQIAMGEGGVIVTDDDGWAALFRSLRNQGRASDGGWLAYARLGYNYRLADMSAALGLAQLRRLDELLEKRARIAAAYTERLSVDGVAPIAPTPGVTRMSWFVYIVRFAPDVDRDLVMADLDAAGIPSRPYFPSIHLQPFYRERFGYQEGDFPHAEAASRATLALPFHPNMELDHVDRVAAAVREVVLRRRGSAAAPRQVSTRTAAAPVSAPRVLEPARHPRESSHIVVEEFLPRAAVSLPSDRPRALIQGRRVLITGAGGTIGSELSRQAAAFEPAQIVMLDRYENGLHAIAEELSNRPFVRPVIGDVTDATRLKAVFADARPEVVLHAAAHKHVPLMELNPCEAVKNNVTGTRRVIEAALDAGASHLVLISTDKAVNPASVMGATKRVAELLLQRASLGTTAQCVSVRFGNVIGSNGSVLHTFVSQVRAGGPVTVTHPDVRRFFMRIPEAAQLVLHAASGPPSGSIAVLDLGQQVPVVDLARHVIRAFGPAGEDSVPIVFTGLRPGEKLTEELVAADETVMPSDVPGINWIVPDTREWDVFEKRLKALESVAAAGDAATTRALLLDLVDASTAVIA